MTKRYTVVFTPRAEKHLDSIFEYISERGGAERANKFVGRIVDDCSSLSRFPKRGTARDDIRPGLRTKGFARRVTIAFSIDAKNDRVAILGVFYGGRDFEALMSGKA